MTTFDELVKGDAELIEDTIDSNIKLLLEAVDVLQQIALNYQQVIDRVKQNMKTLAATGEFEQDYYSRILERYMSAKVLYDKTALDLHKDATALKNSKKILGIAKSISGLETSSTNLFSANVSPKKYPDDDEGNGSGNVN